MVDSLEIVEVKLAVRKSRSVKTVHEIVVGRERYRSDTAGLELDAQTLAECRLAAAARTCDQDEADRVFRRVHASFDLLGDLYDLLFLESLCDLDEVACLAALTCEVYISRVFQTHDAVPLKVFREYLECLRLLYERSKFLRVVSVGNTKEQSVLVHCKAPYLHAACACEQRLVIVVRSTVEGVIVHIDVTGSVQELHLVFVTEFCEEFYCLFSPYLMSAERHVRIDNLTHSCGNLLKVALCDMCSVSLSDIAVISLRNRPSQYNSAVWEDVLCSFAEKKAERVAVNASAHI